MNQLKNGLIVALLLIPPSLLAAPLRVGTTLWSGYDPLYLAQHNGYYNDEIRIINFPSASEVIRSFKNEALEVAALTLDEVAVLLESGIDVRIFLICDISDGGDSLLARPPIASLHGLKGKRIAVEATAVGAYTLTRALEFGHLSLADVTPVHRDNNEQFGAYQFNEVDAVVTYEPVRTQLLNEGAIELFDSSQIPGEIVDVLVVHNDSVSIRQHDLKLLVQGWYKALHDIQRTPETSLKYMAERQRITVDELRSALSGLELPNRYKTRQLMSGSPSSLHQAFKRLIDTMHMNGLLSKKVNPDRITTTRFLP